LLVDDHRSVLWGLSKLIESNAPHTQVAHTATTRAEALAAVHGHNPDMVVLDLDLGPDSGVDLLRDLGPQDRPRFIVLTGSRDSAALELAIRAGARGFVHKSEPAEVLLHAIAAVHAGHLWLDQATTARVLAAFCGRGETPLGDQLSLAERRVIAAVVRNRSAPNKVIADALCISAHTLRNHLASIYDKLGLHHRLDLVLYAMEHGLTLDPARKPSALQRIPAPVAAARAPLPR
jgi:DNA-binding NarL/FixJ family response regulator